MDPFEREERKEEQRGRLKKERRDFRKHQEAVGVVIIIADDHKSTHCNDQTLH